MSSQLHHYTYCPFCSTSVKTELLEEIDDTLKGLKRHATVRCPECGAEIKFKLHWEVTSAEVVSAARTVTE